jgi:hypothetical protein
MIYKSKEKELASLQEELCAKKKAVKETQCSFKYQIKVITKLPSNFLVGTIVFFLLEL